MENFIFCAVFLIKIVDLNVSVFKLSLKGLFVKILFLWHQGDVPVDARHILNAYCHSYNVQVLILGHLETFKTVLSFHYIITQNTSKCRFFVRFYFGLTDIRPVTDTSDLYWKVNKLTGFYTSGIIAPNNLRRECKISFFQFLASEVSEEFLEKFITSKNRSDTL